MAGIPLDEAELFAIFLESFLYGIFFTLFWITLWILLRKQTNPKSNRSLIGVLILMLALSTSHIIIDWVRIIEAFIFHRDPVLGGPIGYYAQISHPLHIAKNVIYACMAVTGDSVMAWRCYVVYRRNLFVIIVPVLLIIASIVSSIVIISDLASAPIGSTIFGTATPWLTAFFILGLCTNTYSTSVIVYQILRSIRSVGSQRKSGSGLMPVIMALVESGGLHATAWLALLVTYLSGSNGQYAALDTITPLVGIVFSLIIIQIDVYASRVTSGSANAHVSWHSGQRAAYTSPGGYPMHPVDITVTTHKATHIDQTHSPTFTIIDVPEAKHLEIPEGRRR